MGTKIKKFQIEGDAFDSEKIKNESILDQDVAISANIQQSKIENLQPTLATKVNLTGDTLTGVLTLNADPVNPLEAATKYYLESSTTGTVQPAYQYLPNLDLLDGVNLTIGPSAFTANGVTQTNNSPITFNLTSPANYDTYVTSAGTYYLYATGTGFKVSKVIPTFVNGLWINNNIDKWRAISTIAKPTTIGNFNPFVKRGVFNRYLTELELTAVSTIAPVFGGPATSAPIIQVFIYCSNTSKGKSSSASFTLYDIDTGLSLEYMFVFGKVASNSSYRAFATVDTQVFQAPVKWTGSTLQIKYAGGRIVTQQGVIEKF